jgi:hypothetical protein
MGALLDQGMSLRVVSMVPRRASMAVRREAMASLAAVLRSSACWIDGSLAVDAIG